MCFNSYWLQMYLRSLGLPFVRSLMLRILLCIPRCFHLLHDGTTNLSSWHHSSWIGLPFFLVDGSFCINDVTALVILFFVFELSSLVLRNKYSFFGTSIHSSLLVGDYVCDLSYKSNAIVWLETFHKEYLYWQTLMHKYMIMQLL